MKIYGKTILYLAAAALVALASCVKERPMGSGPAAGQPVTIRLDADTRVTDAGDPADRTVSSLRVLIYNSASGKLEFNVPVAVPTPATLEIRTGTYDFVFIANEVSDAALAAHLNADADIDNISKLRALSFARNAFDASLVIPMVTLVERVDVAGDNKIKTPAMSDYQTGIWTVPLERAAIRVRLNITLTADQYADWIASVAPGLPFVNISDIPDRAYVLPGIDNSASRIKGELFQASTVVGKSGMISAPDASGNVTVTYDRLILPELFLLPANNVAGKAMVLSMDFGGKVKTGMVKCPDGDEFGYALPRNTFLDLTANVKVDAIDIQAVVLPWNEGGGDLPFDGQYHMTVDKSRFVFASAAGSQQINIFTDYPTGWSILSQTGAWFSVSPATGATGATTPASITCTANAGTTIRSGSFVIAAGNMRKTIYVTQVPDAGKITDATPPTGFTPYVGAFWRANQTGERLIRTPRATSGAADGDWTATVLAGADWIILDRAMTTDPNVGWLPGATESAVENGNDAGFDARHPVGGNVPTVSGTLRSAGTSGYVPGDENIYFRVGLKSQYTPTAAAPARYGVVLLTYKGNTQMQRIWIRQGEGADYLMRSTDASTGGYTGASRPAARQFSPYNLTADRLNMQVVNPWNTGWTASASTSAAKSMLTRGPGDPPIQPPGLIDNNNPSRFTEYPSQAGAFFQWADPVNVRWAWDPYNQNATGTWDQTYPTGYWTDASNLSATHETCPEGYRRPNDGVANAATDNSTSALVANSEMRTSLWLQPQTGSWNANTANTVFGYYADGFFDRRAIVTSVSVGTTTANSTVAVSTADVAYQGYLFFNPSSDSYASLFFPAAGERPDGQLLGAGGVGMYWTSSSGSSGSMGSSWYLQLDRSFPFGAVCFNTLARVSGLSIRCVVDPPVPLSVSPRITWDATGGKYILTDNPTDAGLYFKFGGVVGVFSGSGGKTQNLGAGNSNDKVITAADVAWSPIAIPDWAGIPYLGAATNVNDPSVHTLTNVRAGKGDPCRLVGLDLAGIKAGTVTDIDNGKWRLPTLAEAGGAWADFMNQYYNYGTVSGIDGFYFHPPGGIPSGSTWSNAFLPFAGAVDASGKVFYQTSEGTYWTSSYYDASSAYFTLITNVSSAGIGGSGGEQSGGCAVRCVRQ